MYRLKNAETFLKKGERNWQDFLPALFSYKNYYIFCD